MCSKRWLVVTVVLFGVLLVSAVAEAHDVSFCFYSEVDYQNVDDGDYWVSNSDKHAKGIRAVVYQVGGGFVFNGYANADTGCTPSMSLSQDHTYVIRVYSRAEVTYGNQIHVYKSESDPTYHQQTVDWFFKPYSSGTYNYTYEIINNVHETNILAAASFAIHERRAGLANHNFYMYTEECNVISDTCMKAGIGRIFFGDSGRDKKQTITHELGHLIGLKVDENESAVCNYDDEGGTPATCDCLSVDYPHNLSSREWQTAAANEGIANFYSAAIWNDNSEYDCEYKGYDCESPSDHLDDCCEPYDNKAVEWDWLNFWWDMHTNVGLSVRDVFKIWDEANPKNWTDEYVYERLRDAADDEGVSVEVWDYWGEDINHVNE